MKKPIDHKLKLFIWNFFKDNPVKYKSKETMIDYLSSILYLSKDIMFDVIEDLEKTNSIELIQRGNKWCIKLNEYVDRILPVVELKPEEPKPVFELQETVEEETEPTKRRKRKSEE